MPTAPKMGTIGWLDLTVPDAEGVRDFYRKAAASQPRSDE
jgi:predicted enzyme related to lactoylglutathione lyase